MLTQQYILLCAIAFTFHPQVYSFIVSVENRGRCRSCSTMWAKKPRNFNYDTDYLDKLMDRGIKRSGNFTLPPRQVRGENLLFPELEAQGIDERKIRQSPFGKVLFKVLEFFFPIFNEPNWYDKYDPPLSAEANLELPYFDGYDFANSSWTMYIRHRYGVWNWLDRMGVIPSPVAKFYIRDDGHVAWSDGYYGDWYINPAINFFQFDKRYSRGHGAFPIMRGFRFFQVNRWNFEESIGRYWQRGMRSTLRNASEYYAIEGRIWATQSYWRPYPRDSGKFVAIRDGTNLTEVFGSMENTPWERRFLHAMSLPFYQAHPDQLERIEDNFDMYYRNLLGREVR